LIRSGTLKIAGDTHFDGTLRIEQQAELQLAGPYQFEPTARLSGSGRVSGDLVMPGTIAPGISTGTLALDNNLTLANTSHLEIELGGTEAGAQYGRLSIGGFAELDGTLQVSLTNDFVPVADNLFQVLHASGGIFSQFDDVELPELAPDFTWNLIYSNFAVLLQVVAPNVAILAGDYNHDGTVDAADYVVWRSTLGQLGAGLTADGNANGEIDAGDYDVWRASFGNTTAASTAHLAPSESLGDNDAAVPEPASIALWLLALPLLPRRQV
jgi:hypothetical protein